MLFTRNRLWARHSHAIFTAVVVNSEICTIIANAPDSWGVQLLALGCSKLDEHEWFYPSLFTQSQFYTIDPAVQLYQMSNMRSSALKLQQFDELRNTKDVPEILSLSKRARALIQQDLYFKTSVLLTNGQLDSILESHALGINGEQFNDVFSAIDFADRRYSKSNSDGRKDSASNSSSIKYLLQQKLSSFAANTENRITSQLRIVSSENFGNRGRYFRISRNVHGQQKLELTRESDSYTRYTPIYRPLTTDVTEQSIKLDVEALLHSTRLNAAMLDNINNLLLASTEAVPTLAIIEDLEGETRAASSSDRSVVIESASLIDLFGIYSNLTVVKCQSDVGSSMFIVLLRCTVKKQKHARNATIEWLPLITISKIEDVRNFGLKQLWGMWLENNLMHIESAVNSGQISNAELKSARAITNLFNRVKCYNDYNCMRLKTSIPWFDTLNREANAWIAKSFLKRLASGSRAVVVVKRKGKYLEINDYNGSSDGMSEQSVLISELFSVTEEDLVCVVGMDHIVFEEVVNNDVRLSYLSFSEMMEKGWRPGKIALYAETERVYRRLVKAESLLGQFAQFDLEIVLVDLFKHNSVGLNDLVTQVLSAFDVFQSNRSDKVELFGVCLAELMTLPGRMQLDDYLRGIDWPALIQTRAG
ncbi:hypothetical protein [Pseudomonas sp. NPDC096950]|uniref:hypothetical protein n=1 Tax=Pseudomonas sp. NPDC096950 TaxID=3364485 RepID=UPI003839E3AD